MLTDNKGPNQINTGGGNAVGGNATVKDGDFIVGNKFQNFISPTNVPLTGSAPARPKLILGRENELSDLKIHFGILPNGQLSTTRQSQMAVHGTPGVGKTTLVAALTHDDDIKQVFSDGVLWASLGPEPNLFSWLTAWGRSLNVDLTNARTLEEASAQLTAFLIKQKRLLIVDDVWNPKHAKPFEIGGSGCAMLITTRSLSIAEAFAPTANGIYKLHPLDNEKAREVLRELAPTVIEQNPKELDKLIKELGGLPLMLQAVGRSLNTAVSRGFFNLDKLTELTGAKLLRLIVPTGMEQMENTESSILALFQKSTDPLSEKIINYFAYLGIFAQSPATFDLASMQAVWQLEYPESVVAELIDGGLLEHIAEQKSYQMHSLFHHHARSLLTDKEAKKASQNHFNFFQHFATEYPDTDLNQWKTEKTQEFEALYPQLKQALVNFELGYGVGVPTTGDEQTQQMMNLIDTLDKYWLYHHSFDAQAKWLVVAYQCAQTLKSPIQAADFARRIGRVKGLQGELAEAFTWIEACEALLGGDASHKANRIRAWAYIHRAFLNYQQNELSLAQKDCMRGLSIMAERETEIYAEAYNLLGAIKLTKNKISAAQKDFEKSISAWLQLKNHYQIARVEDNIRSTHFYLGNIQYLRDAEEKGLQNWEKSPNRIELATALINRAEIHRIDREYDIAIEYQNRALEIGQRIKVPRIEALAKSNLAWSYISLGEYDTAATLLKEREDIRDEFHLEEYSIDARLCLIELEMGRKNYTEALKNAKIALQEAHEVGDLLEKGCAQRVLGQIYHLLGKTELARKQLEKSLSQLEKNEYRYESFLTMQALIQFYEDTGDTEKTQATKQKAQDLSTQMGLLPPKA